MCGICGTAPCPPLVHVLMNASSRRRKTISSSRVTIVLGGVIGRTTSNIRGQKNYRLVRGANASAGTSPKIFWTCQRTHCEGAIPPISAARSIFSLSCGRQRKCTVCSCFCLVAIVLQKSVSNNVEQYERMCVTLATNIFRQRRTMRYVDAYEKAPDPGGASRRPAKNRTTSLPSLQGIQGVIANQSQVRK